jgi:hypothetical protein
LSGTLETMPWRSIFALAVALAVGVSAEGSEVLASPGGVTIRTEATPVSQVLDQLAKEAGIRIIYDGPPPRDLVTVDRHSRTLAEAIPALLEGLGLSYVLKMDASGTEVETLFLAGRAALGTTVAAASPASSSRAERIRQILEQRRAQEQEPAAPSEDSVDEPPVPADEPEGPPPDSFPDAVAAAQQAQESDAGAQQQKSAAPPVQIAPSSSFTPSPFGPPPPPPQPPSNP